jgi:hypothetical protein
MVEQRIYLHNLIQLNIENLVELRLTNTIPVIIKQNKKRPCEEMPQTKIKYNLMRKDAV